jgi:hypothetical protein
LSQQTHVGSGGARDELDESAGFRAGAPDAVSAEGDLGQPPIIRARRSTVGFLAPQTLERVSQVDSKNVQEVTASQLAIINNYYANVLSQARQSFVSALAAAAVGLAFFVAAVAFIVATDASRVSTISVISGALVEVIAGINFYLYGKAAAQLAAFHPSLERTFRFTLANSLIENLEGPLKQTVRAELVRVIAQQGSLEGTDHPSPAPAPSDSA